MIYLDHAAAEPLIAAARGAILEALDGPPLGNPSSVHAAGRRARALVERAREGVSAALGAAADDVVLTSGGTEALGLAIAGSALPRLRAGHRVAWCTCVDHPAVQAALEALVPLGLEPRRLAVPRGVPPAPEALAAQVGAGAALVVCPWIHHETGLVFPVREYAAALAPLGVPLVLDAVQALGRVAIDVARLGVQALAVASQKIGGPPGAGALWVRRGAAFDPPRPGGGQERGRRAGTEPVLAVVGFGAAAREVPSRLAGRQELDGLAAAWIDRARMVGAETNAEGPERHPAITSVAVEGVRADHLVAALDVAGVAVSAGSACSSGRAEPSQSLLAMYPEAPWRARSSIRASFGPSTTPAEVERAAELFADVVLRQRTSTGT